MTNEEKFKTILERRYAYREDCRKSGKILGEFSWLEMEYKEELRLLPCPFCGGAPVMADNIETMRSLSYFVRCACGTRTVSALSESAAAEIWNRRVK